MYSTNYHIHTSKEIPSDAEIISHQLMIRAGMIRKISKGIYTYMPLGLRVLRKIEAIIRDEMNNAGAIELLMPMTQPVELWKESGRLSKYGLELLNFQDRHKHNFVLQPTSEEVITKIARDEIHSYRQLPITFYHIQTKFRDELRPRFGLIRSREFIMKDAYSFDCDEIGARKSYNNMFNAYERIFKRLGLKFCAISADTGPIGGTISHEFQIMTNIGEDLIVYNSNSNSAENLEFAEAPCLISKRDIPVQSISVVSTPEIIDIMDITKITSLPIEKIVKSIMIISNSENGKENIYLLLLRGDHELNQTKVKKLPGLTNFRFATKDEVFNYFSCDPNYLGPFSNIEKPVCVIADLTVAKMSNFICGSNKQGTHYIGVNWNRDMPEPDLIVDLRNVVDGDPALKNKGILKICKGIEVGHIFLLGTKYSKALQANFLNINGKLSALQMGCYGIGITRIISAVIEQNHDKDGMIWPRNLAPFEIVICPINWHKNYSLQKITLEIYNSLYSLGIDVILDNRDIRPGVMFSEWELIGIPLRILIGQRDLENGVIELQVRQEKLSFKVEKDVIIERILKELEKL